VCILNINFGRYSAMPVRGSVAEWLGSRTRDLQVGGSNPGHRATDCILAAECNPGQVVHLRSSRLI